MDMQIVFWLLLLGASSALVIWPRIGLVSRWRRWRTLQRRAELEDALKVLVEREHQGQTTNAAALSSQLRWSRSRGEKVLRRLDASGLVLMEEGVLRPTPDGERWGLQVVRAHRLMERYLADEARMPLPRVHGVADRAEHALSEAELDALEARLGHPRQDPHGDPIPDRLGTLEAQATSPLLDWPVGRPAIIRHIEDEPPAVFRQLAAFGLQPGSIVRMLERRPDRISLSDGQEILRLAPEVAANVFVAEAPEVRADFTHLRRLSELQDGEQATVVSLEPALRGFSRRRMLDLGVTPGASIRAELRNAFGDPRAFRVRGTLIALRGEQAHQIWVRRD